MFFRIFVRILSFSLYKGSLEDWEKTGLRIGNRTQFHILLWIAFKKHPTLSHQPYYGSSSGAKVNILFQLSKSIHTFFFRACSLFLQSLWHLVWHLPERCVLGYVLLLNICDVSYTLDTLTWVFSTPLVQEVYLGIPWVTLKMCDRWLHPSACLCLGMRTPPFLNLCPCRE